MLAEAGGGQRLLSVACLVCSLVLIDRGDRGLDGGRRELLLVTLRGLLQFTFLLLQLLVYLGDGCDSFVEDLILL